ncbi:phosphate transport system regulatory protein PhoU [Bombiscardovia nodaiensis]|uniref:Phosphate-specific transport system accessory protein PhoU n=1 Tax=Bombiscardovia nodaiensis TaxID=2932181 RepID=A0ABM8B6U6_9BIFI|nr:phosphate transport system regulatory protein PhoU [Bombiscardovia nodaiensis]
MRKIFNEEMRQVADDMEQMAGAVSRAIHTSGQALLGPDLQAAQEVIDGDQAIDQLEASVIDQCVQLLAKQSPVATDLRVVVSTLRLAATFERMGDLSRHIAEAVRRSYPDSPLPPEARDLFERMQAFLNTLADRLVDMMSERNTKVAEQIIVDDDQLDQLHQQTFDLALSDQWQGSKQQMIDLVLLARFMERIGDHGVSAARRVVYIVSGFDPSKDPKDLEDID